MLCLNSVHVWISSFTAFGGCRRCLNVVLLWNHILVNNLLHFTKEDFPSVLGHRCKHWWKSVPTRTVRQRVHRKEVYRCSNQVGCYNEIKEIFYLIDMVCDILAFTYIPSIDNISKLKESTPFSTGSRVVQSVPKNLHMAWKHTQ